MRNASGISRRHLLEMAGAAGGLALLSGMPGWAQAAKPSRKALRAARSDHIHRSVAFVPMTRLRLHIARLAYINGPG